MMYLENPHTGNMIPVPSITVSREDLRALSEEMEKNPNGDILSIAMAASKRKQMMEN